MSNQDLVNRLARSCAWGSRQLMFVNELIAGKGFRHVVIPPGCREGYMEYGHSQMGTKSWKSLKRRLVQNGFYIKIEPIDAHKARIVLEFSE